MRIAKFEIVNYKGIARAAIGELENLPVVLISGRNGTGKTLLVEAILALWNGRVNLPDMVGPWGDQLSIAIEIVLDPEEVAIVDDWHFRERGFHPPLASAHRYAVAASRLSNSARIVEHDSVIETLRNRNFRIVNPFASIEYVAAGRQFSTGAGSVVDLGLLSRDRRIVDVEQMQDQALLYRTGMQMPDVGSYLLSLDYQRFLAQRQQVQAPEDFQVISDAFEAATGKRILQPQYDASTQTSAIRIELTSGPSHGLDDLSQGEKEMLALMYFVRRINSSGGILALDEPERHLHPALQVALFGVMRELADRSQVLVVTHSASLIAAASTDSLVTMEAPRRAGDEQLCTVSSRFDRGRLLEQLGVTPGLLSQTDALVVVEGERDASWLRSLFPIELGRALVRVAGSGNQVIAAHEALEAIDPGIPWLCIRDRDLLSDAQVAALSARHSNLYVWPFREFENGLLDQQLLTATVSAVREVDPDFEEEVIRATAGLKHEVVDGLVLARLKELHPMLATSAIRGDAPLRRQSEVLANRANAYDRVRDIVDAEVSSRWARDWRILVDGKLALKTIFAVAGAYRSASEFIEALLRRARDQPEIMPVAFSEFHRALIELLAASPEARDARRTITAIGPTLADEDRVARALSSAEPEPEYNLERYEGGGC